VSDVLYLDTARLGRMTPQARLADHAFADWAAEEGGSVYFERFLRSGIHDLPADIARRHARLSGWHGIDHLKQTLRTVAGAPAGFPVLLANRSAQLMKLAARVLFHPCRNVLTTDLDWPGYRDILEAECRRAGRRLTTIPVRDAAVRGQLTEPELLERVQKTFGAYGCDGLFLTAVSHDGIRLPISHIVESLDPDRVMFSVVDGAQDFCHARSDFRACDLFLASAHKWLGAYHPLGLGFYGRLRSAERIETILTAMLDSDDLDDPLLRRTAGSRAEQRVPETLGIAALLTCQGAAGDTVDRIGSHPDGHRRQLANATAIEETVRDSGWVPLAPNRALRTGILMLQAQGDGLRLAEPDVVREAIRDQGVSVSTYPGGRVRLSMPLDLLTEADLERVRHALRTAREQLD
jgi:selenocysteine lyase/cysteine desulfurase